MAPSSFEHLVKQARFEHLPLSGFFPHRILASESQAQTFCARYTTQVLQLIFRQFTPKSHRNTVTSTDCGRPHELGRQHAELHSLSHWVRLNLFPSTRICFSYTLSRHSRFESRRSPSHLPPLSTPHSLRTRPARSYISDTSRHTRLTPRHDACAALTPQHSGQHRLPATSLQRSPDHVINPSALTGLFLNSTSQRNGTFQPLVVQKLHWIRSVSQTVLTAKSNVHSELLWLLSNVHIAQPFFLLIRGRRIPSLLQRNWNLGAAAAADARWRCCFVSCLRMRWFANHFLTCLGSMPARSPSCSSSTGFGYGWSRCSWYHASMIATASSLCCTRLPFFFGAAAAVVGAGVALFSLSFAEDATTTFGLVFGALAGFAGRKRCCRQ